jgi:hypothetical protein
MTDALMTDILTLEVLHTAMRDARELYIIAVEMSLIANEGYLLAIACEGLEGFKAVNEHAALQRVVSGLEVKNTLAAYVKARDAWDAYNREDRI